MFCWGLVDVDIGWFVGLMLGNSAKKSNLFEKNVVGARLSCLLVDVAWGFRLSGEA